MEKITTLENLIAELLIDQKSSKSSKTKHLISVISNLYELIKNNLEEEKKMREDLRRLTSIVSDQIIGSSIRVLQSRVSSIEEKLEYIRDGKETKTVQKSRSFAQYGEDEWITSNLNIQENGYFIEVGTGDGITYSNTYLFEKMGWIGVCFEPDPRNYKEVINYRDLVMDCAISTKEGKLKFSQASSSADYSGLDIEDSNKEEIDVWNSFDNVKYLPDILIIEYNSNGRINDKIKPVLAKSSLQLVHTTTTNYIYAKKKLIKSGIK